MQMKMAFRAINAWHRRELRGCRCQGELEDKQAKQISSLLRQKLEEHVMQKLTNMYEHAVMLSLCSW